MVLTFLGFVLNPKAFANVCNPFCSHRDVEKEEEVILPNGIRYIIMLSADIEAILATS